MFLITCKKETGEVYLTLLSVVFSIIVASNSEAEKTSLPFSLWRDGDSRGLGSNVKVVAGCILYNIFISKGKPK